VVGLDVTVSYFEGMPLRAHAFMQNAGTRDARGLEENDLLACLPAIRTDPVLPQGGLTSDCCEIRALFQFVDVRDGLSSPNVRSMQVPRLFLRPASRSG